MSPNDLPDLLYHSVFPVGRWLHIVATTLLVGGTLFYELVVPIAIEDLKHEDQLYVFARARWVFRWVVRVSALILTLSGLVTLWRTWESYRMPFPVGFPPSFPWAMAHIAAGVLAMIIALVLTTGGRPPQHPIGWMRINLVILLVGMFLASTARHVRLTIRERYISTQSTVEHVLRPPVIQPAEDDSP